MEYIQELESLVGDIGTITKEELEILNEFTDEKVGFKDSMKTDYSQSQELCSAFLKIAEKNKMVQYIEILSKHTRDSIEEFYHKYNANDNI